MHSYGHMQHSRISIYITILIKSTFGIQSFNKTHGTQ